LKLLIGAPRFEAEILVGSSGEPSRRGFSYYMHIIINGKTNTVAYDNLQCLQHIQAMLPDWRQWTLIKKSTLEALSDEDIKLEPLKK